MRAPRLRALHAAILLIAATALATSVGSARADDSYDYCNSGQVAGLTFAATTVAVAVGSGGASLPAVTTTCDGNPVTTGPVNYSLTDGTAHAVFANSGGTTSESAANGAMVIIAGTTTAGTFTVNATWSGTTATIPGTVSGQLTGTLAPAEPAANQQERLTSCTGIADVSDRCEISSAADINTARQAEGTGPLLLPTNWTSLTVPQQLLVITDLERTARGLPSIPGLADDLNTDAQAGAEADGDPDFANVPPGSSGGGGNWAGGDVNALQADFGWLYDDGLNSNGTSSNGDCRPGGGYGCWGHRDNILFDSGTCYSPCAMGAGYDATGKYGTSYAEEFILGTSGPDVPLVFTWANELTYLPTCEQNGDTCSYSMVPPIPAPPKPLQAPVNASVALPGGSTAIGTVVSQHHQVVIAIPTNTRHGRPITVKVASLRRFTVTITFMGKGHRRIARTTYRGIPAGQPGTVWSFRVNLPGGRKGQIVTVSVTVTGDDHPVTRSGATRLT